VTWHKQRQLVDEAGAIGRKRGPKVDSAAAEARRVRELENEVEHLSAKVTETGLVFDVQKNFSFCWA
jgi:transposase